jgi:acetyltransferase-like isoleucine patch superfamily enzyme
MREYSQKEYLEMCEERGMFLGKYDPVKVSGLWPQWFWDRRCELIDFRGDLQLRSAVNITCGFRVVMITASHSFASGQCGEVELKRVWVEEHVFIGSGSLLYNCHLQHHALVSVGSVVRNMVVPPYCMVEGNPARIVREYRDGRWRKTENCQVG